MKSVGTEPIPRVKLSFAAGAVLAAMVWVGCESPLRTEGAVAVDQQAQRDAERREAERQAQHAAIRAADVMDLTARQAAQRVAMMAAIDDPIVEREIMLYETLYHAAYITNIGRITEHYLLDLPDEPSEAWHPQDVQIEESELLLRVLARLDRLNVPMRWMPADASEALTEPVHFPGTRKLATRLGVRIIERTEEGDIRGPIVLARLTDATAHIGGARQNVTAVWSGTQWQLSRDPGLQVW